MHVELLDIVFARLTRHAKAEKGAQRRNGKQITAADKKSVVLVSLKTNGKRTVAKSETGRIFPPCLKETHQFAYRFLTVSKYLPIDVVYNRVTLNAEWPSGFVMLDTDRRIEDCKYFWIVCYRQF